MRRRFLRCLIAWSAALGLGAVWAVAGRLEETDYPLDHPAIQYYQEAADPVARLRKRLENGQAKLDFAPDQDQLTTHLRQLDNNIESQVSVFSKSNNARPLEAVPGSTRGSRRSN